MTKLYILDIVWREKETPTKSKRKMFISKSFIADSQSVHSSLCTLSDGCHWMTSVTETDVHTIDRRTNTNTHTQHAWSKRKTDEIIKIIVAMFCFKC